VLLVWAFSYPKWKIGVEVAERCILMKLHLRVAFCCILRCFCDAISWLLGSYTAVTQHSAETKRHTWTDAELAKLEDAARQKKTPAQIHKTDLPNVPRTSIASRLARLRTELGLDNIGLRKGSSAQVSALLASLKGEGGTLRQHTVSPEPYEELGDEDTDDDDDDEEQLLMTRKKKSKLTSDSAQTDNVSWVWCFTLGDQKFYLCIRKCPSTRYDIATASNGTSITVSSVGSVSSEEVERLSKLIGIPQGFINIHFSPPQIHTSTFSPPKPVESKPTTLTEPDDPFILVAFPFIGTVQQLSFT